MLSVFSQIIDFHLQILKTMVSIALAADPCLNRVRVTRSARVHTPEAGCLVMFPTQDGVCQRHQNWVVDQVIQLRLEGLVLVASQIGLLGAATGHRGVMALLPTRIVRLHRARIVDQQVKRLVFLKTQPSVTPYSLPFLLRFLRCNFSGVFRLRFFFVDWQCCGFFDFFRGLEDRRSCCACRW